MSQTRDIVIAAPCRSSVPRVSHRIFDAASALPGAMKDALGKSLPPLMDAVDRLGQAISRHNVRVIDARARAVIDGMRAAPSGLVSATSGYVRDSAGNRLRPMTPADLQAIADKHYGRAR